MRRRNALRFEGNPEAKPSREAVTRGRARRTNEFARSPKSSPPPICLARRITVQICKYGAESVALVAASAVLATLEGQRR